MSRSCLIIGAGMAGLTAARELTHHAWDVTILDKGRGVGGRMATRRMGNSRLDHGAQFFTTRSEAFCTAVAAWQRAGWVSPWYTGPDPGDVHTRYRAINGMNALAKQLAQPFHVRTEAKVTALQADQGRWQATTEAGETFEADALILTPPAPQTLALLGPLAPDVTSKLADVHFHPCFALMLTLSGPSLLPPPGYARPTTGPIEWLADNTMKGISEGPAAITLHATGAFTREHLSAAPAHVTSLLVEAAAPYLGSAVTASQLHRWLYARPVADHQVMCLSSDEPAPLAVAGDALAGSRIEGAFLSGLAAARQIQGLRS